MSRTRVVLGLTAVLIGTAWWAGALAELGRSTIAVAPYVLIVLAVLGYLRVEAPAAAWVAPGLMLSAGVAWLLVRGNLVPGVDLATVLAVILIVGGCVVALSRRRQQWRPDLVRRHASFLWRRRPIRLTGAAPARLALTAVLGELVVDLTGAEYPTGAEALEIDITAVGGHVDIRLRPDWQVGPGRIIERAVHLDGTLDWVTPGVLLSADDLPEHIAAGKPVVVNVTGLLGAVTLPRRSAPRR